MTPLSVVVPHYGDPAPTVALLDQLRQQPAPFPVQVLVVDDASPTPFPDGDGYAVVRRSINGGYGAAVNSGARQAAYAHLLVLNSDLSVPPGFLTDLMEQSAPWQPAIVSTRVRQGAGELCVGRRWPTVSQQVVENLAPLARFHGRRWLEHHLGNDVRAWTPDAATPTEWLVGACLLLPTEHFRSVGGFDERFFMNCEEIDLQRRLVARFGMPVVLLPGPIVEHVGGGSSDASKRTGWVTDARMRYHHKWGGDRRLGAALLATCAVNFGWDVARRVAGRPTAPWADLRSRLGILQHAWETR